MLYRNRVRDASVIIKSTVYFHRTAGGRYSAGGHDQSVVVLCHSFFSIIFRLPGFRICYYYLVFGRIFHKGREIQGIFSSCVGQCAVNVGEPKKVSCFQKTIHAEVFFVMDMFCKKPEISSPLPGKI